MTNEEKQLLLKDICARLPYGVMIKDTYSGHYGRLVEIGNRFAHFISKLNSNTLDVQLSYIKPYLRPMSSMVSKEWLKYCDACVEDEKSWVLTEKEYNITPVTHREEFFNSHHFDYCGLIDKGLAIEAPEGMYKTE